MTPQLHRSSNAPELWDTIEAFEMDEPATYLYCIVHSAVAPVTAKAPPGLPGTTCPAVVAVANAFWLVTTAVPLKTYGSAPLEAALRDVQWVADVAMAHESVVEFFARQPGATVIPMKLFTMFSSDRRAASQTRTRLREIEAVVSRIAGCEEWGVRISHRPPAATRAPGRHTKSSSGTAFLAAKKLLVMRLARLRMLRRRWPTRRMRRWRQSRGRLGAVTTHRRARPHRRCSTQRFSFP
jgi:hypothetical protein